MDRVSPCIFVVLGLRCVWYDSLVRKNVLDHIMESGHAAEGLRAVARNPALPFPLACELIERIVDWHDRSVCPAGLEGNFLYVELPALLMQNKGLTGSQRSELAVILVEGFSSDISLLLDYMLQLQEPHHGDLVPAYEVLRVYREQHGTPLGKLTVPVRWSAVLRTRRDLPESIIMSEWNVLKGFVDREYGIWWRGLLRQDACPVVVLVEACRHWDARVRAMASEHPNCPEESRIVAVLLRDSLV